MSKLFNFSLPHFSRQKHGDNTYLKTVVKIILAELLINV